MHIKDGHKKLRKSKEKEKTMRRTRSMLAVLGIVCALSGITGCSNRNGNTLATNGSESNMQNGSNGIQTESNMQNGSSGTQAESNMQNGSSGTQAESNTQKNNSTKKNRNQSDTSQSRRTDGADGVLDDAGDIVRDAGDAVGDVVDDLTGETTGRSRMTE